MKRTALTLLATALIQFGAAAQVESVLFPFMEFSHDAVRAAMGGVSLLQDRNDVALSYQNWSASSTSYANLDAAATFGALTLKAGVTAGIIADAEASGISEKMISIGAGYRFSRMLAAEVKGRYCSAGCSPDVSASGFNADALLKGFFKDARVALGVTGLGPRVQGFRQPSALAFAGACGKEFGERTDTHSIEAEIDVKYYLVGAVAASAGVEYCYNRLLSVRAGAHAGGITGTHASVGLGLSLKGFHIDGCYLVGGQITNSFCIGLGYRF